MGDILLFFDKEKTGKMRAIIAYLIIYGNTRKDDLVIFATKTYHLPRQEVIELIREMCAYGFIEEIIHKLLQRNSTYLRVGSLAPTELKLGGISKTLDLYEFGKIRPNEAKAILDQAGLAAEKISK